MFLYETMLHLSDSFSNSGIVALVLWAAKESEVGFLQKQLFIGSLKLYHFVVPFKHDYVFKILICSPSRF